MTGNHQNSILTSSYMAQKFNGLDNKRNTFSVTPTSHVRQSAWFLPFENTNMKIKSSFDKQDFLRRLKACCSGLTIGVLLASIALAVILTLWLYRTTTTASSILSPTTTAVRILWTFDGNLNDFYNNFPGTPINAPTYRSPGINGYGTCLYLNASRNQSVTVYSPPFLNMVYTPFSLIAWVKPATLRNDTSSSKSDNAIFGQHQNNSKDHSFHVVIRRKKSYLGFYNDDSQGNIILNPGNWYHIAFVYDYSTLTQYIYVNGILDVSNTPREPYKGETGDLTIGTNGIHYPYNFWDGCLDQISYFSRAKTSTEILREATLTVNYSFDNDSLLDDGPLGINGTGLNYTFSGSCRVKKCLSLLNNPSYIQAGNLVLLGTTNQSYSFSIWINPTIINQGTIIHASQNSAGNGWCVPMLGFTSSSAIGVQSWSQSIVALMGPAAVANVWTHIAITYSATNGLRLWINGSQYGSGTVGFPYIAFNGPMFVTIGLPVNGQVCASSIINKGEYTGYIDEFALYSRELNSADIINLANP